MSALFQFFLFLLTLNNLALLGMGRLRTLINLVTAQGILLGGLLLIHDHALLAVAVLLIKGGLLPWLLHRTRRQIGADPHIKPRLGFGLAVLTGLACLVFSLWLEGRLPMTKTATKISSSRVSSNQTAPAVMSGMPSRKMPFSATR